MVSRVLPLVYQRFWRPLGGRLLMGLDRAGNGGGAPDGAGDALDRARRPGPRRRLRPRQLHSRLRRGGERGPRRRHRRLGLDAGRRRPGHRQANVAYLRGDACALPFRDGSFDAVCCFAALYLIEEPMRALAEIVRVLAPGGRLALLTSCNRGLLPAGAASAIVRGLSGVRVFGRDELTRRCATTV